MTELLIRLTLLLLIALVTNYALRRMEPSWRLAVFRFGFIAMVLLAVTAVMKPAWNLPVLDSSSPSAGVITESIVPAGNLSVSNSPGASAVVHSRSSVSVANLFLYLWASVAAILVVRQIYTHFRLSAEVSRLQTAPTHIQKLWAMICREFDAGPTEVKIAVDNRSPFLGQRGELVLPPELCGDEMPSGALRHVLRHEAAHLAAKDHIWLPAASALTKVLWFHPLAWWFNASHVRACEDTRDAQAARFGGAAHYRSTLATLALNWLPVQGSTAGLFRKRSDLLRRLKAVQHTVDQQPAPPSARFTVGAMTLTMGALFGGIALVPQTGRADDDGMSGVWVSTDPNTRYVKKLEVVGGDKSTLMKLYISNGKGIDPSPTLIEFPTSASVKDGVSRDFGFKVQTYALETTRKGLSLHTTTTYTDDSGRKDRKDEWTFTRVSGEKKRVNDGKGEQGWAGFWKNEDVGSQGTLQLEIAGNKLRAWGRLGGDISPDPVSESELMIAETTATSTNDHGFAKVTYNLERLNNGRLKVQVETDFTDPKRHDSRHIWLFERGKF